MNNQYLSAAEAEVINNLMPGNQNIGLGSKLKYALSIGKARKGDDYYVDASIAAGAYQDGLSWETAFNTITKALVAAGDYDTIRIAAGDYDEGAVMNITQKGLHIIGEDISENGYPTLIMASAANHVIFVIKANEVVIANCGFVQTNAKAAIEIGAGAGEAWYKIIIRGCKFDGWGTCTYGIANGSGADVPDITIENNLFRSIDTGCILTNSTRAIIRNNRFILTGLADVGIVHSPNGGDRPDTQIICNEFIAYDATNGVGITVSNTPTAGYLYVKGNQFVNFADNNHCISKRTGYTGLNYLGITAIAIT